MKRKTTLFLPVLLLLTILLTVSASAAAFEDVPEDAYFAPAVQWALDNGVTTGTSSTTFSPDATCTRGQVVTFLYPAVRSRKRGPARLRTLLREATMKKPSYGL